MEERCFSKQVYEAERILGFKKGYFQRIVRSFSWGDFNLCRDLDQSSCRFTQIFNENNQLKENSHEESAERRNQDIFQALGFIFSLLVYLERHCEDYTRNFAQRAPNQFEAWMADRHRAGRRKNMHLV